MTPLDALDVALSPGLWLMILCLALVALGLLPREVER